MNKELFEGIAKTNTTHTAMIQSFKNTLFEGIAKTNTTHTKMTKEERRLVFEGIAKTNTTHTLKTKPSLDTCLRVLLKQILPTP